jgi:hypothetical protein
MEPLDLNVQNQSANAVPEAIKKAKLELQAIN